MDYLPVFLDLTSKKCVIIGGGEVAHRKAKLLLKTEALVHIVAAEFSKRVRDLNSDACTLVTEEFNKRHLTDAVLVIAATDSASVNREVATAANSLNIPVNVVDEPALCSCIMPALIDKSPVVIAISTGGNSPVLTRRLKELIEIILPNNIGALSKLMGSWRVKVKNKLDSFDMRLKFWEEVMESDVPDLVFKNNTELANKTIQDHLDNAPLSREVGEVYLVGAGPGDSDLLTLRALRLMYQADGFI